MKKPIWNSQLTPYYEAIRSRVTVPSRVRFLLDDDVTDEGRRLRKPTHRIPNKLAAYLKERYDYCDCEACGWTPSVKIQERFTDWRNLIHAHHVIPRSCGGPNIRQNLVLLCPICHALAHRLGRIIRVKKGLCEWSGPMRRETTIAEIKELLDSTTGATTKPSDLQTA